MTELDIKKLKPGHLIIYTARGQSCLVYPLITNKPYRVIEYGWYGDFIRVIDENGEKQGYFLDLFKSVPINEIL